MENLTFMQFLNNMFPDNHRALAFRDKYFLPLLAKWVVNLIVRKVSLFVKSKKFYNKQNLLQHVVIIKKHIL